MRRTSLCVLFLGLAGLVAGTSSGQDKPSPIHIGMVRTFFNDVPGPLVDLVTKPFPIIMHQATGLSGELIVGGDAFDVAQKLHDGKLQLGVFHGFEFAWVQQKYPDLCPHMVAYNPTRQVCAYVLVNDKAGPTDFAGLKGKVVALPARTKEHCKVFLERNCTGCGHCGSDTFFAKTVAPANIELALDSLSDGTGADAVVLDSLGTEFYKDLKPGRFGKLRALKQSDPFPPAVIAYCKGGVDEATLAKLRDGLVNAHKLELGREILTKMWKVASFEPVPDDYAASLAACLKAYPAPDTAAKLSRRE